MNKIEFIKEKIPFTQVANGVLTDSRLSAKAKGLYAYLYSKPDGWDFAVARICLEMADGKASITEGLQELEWFGFLTRKRQADGRVVYLVHFPPVEPLSENQQMEQKPLSEKATMGKSHNGKIGQVSNKDSLVIKNSNKERVSGVGFEEFWVIYPEKIAKHKALSSWLKMNEEEIQRAIIAIKKQVESNHFMGNDGKNYIPYPATWLNQKRWDDEIKKNNTPKGIIYY